MSKRRLSDQQRRRIHDKQQAFVSNTTDGAELNGLVITCFGAQADVEVLDGDLKGSIVRCHLRASLGSIVTGDKVYWCAGEAIGEPTGVIVAVENRYSVLLRPDKYHHLKPIASNIDQMIIVIAPEPQPFPNLIDRYLVAAHASSIQPVIFLNKTDCIDQLDKFLNELQLELYAQLGYKFLQGTATDNDGPHSLRACLNNKTSVFVGQSGVGKSSLINTLIPEAERTIGDLSEIGKGSHTTTTARLFHLPEGGRVIDSPGIREYGLWHLEPDNLAECFVEFRPYLGTCKFRNCSHHHEPNCAIQQAIIDGEISSTRFSSYQMIKAEMEEHQASKY